MGVPCRLGNFFFVHLTFFLVFHKFEQCQIDQMSKSFTNRLKKKMPSCLEVGKLFLPNVEKNCSPENRYSAIVDKLPCFFEIQLGKGTFETNKASGIISFFLPKQRKVFCFLSEHFKFLPFLIWGSCCHFVFWSNFLA